MLKSSRLPTLDDLEDERNSDRYSVGLVMRAAGRDVAAALRVEDGRAPLRWAAFTRLRWSDYLLAPFAPLVLKSDEVAGRSVVRLRLEGADLLVAFEGRVALASNDREFLAQALRRSGTETSADRPLAARVDFGNAPALLEARRAIGDSGVLAQVRMETVRAIEASADLSETAILFDMSLEGAEPVREGATAPQAFARLAPPDATGTFVSATGVQDVLDGLRSMLRPGSLDPQVALNLREALAALDEAGFSSSFLPKFDPGMAIVIGSVERESRVYPAVAFILPAKDLQGAVDALSHVIMVRGGRMAETNFKSHPVGDATLWSFRWPESAQLNDFFSPCFAALPDAFVFGNNFAFTEAILRGAGGEGGMTGLPLKKLRECGIAPEPGLAGGVLLLPAIRESLDGPVPRIASYLVEQSMGPAAVFRAKLVAEKRQEGRVLTSKEEDDLFYDRVHKMEQDKEKELREALHALDFTKWFAFSLHPGPKGATLRVALEFR